MRGNPGARPLLKTADHGEPVEVQAKTIGARGDRWVEPFLEANRPHFHRLRLEPEVRADRTLRVRLHPQSRIGAIPLLSPSTRRVVAGVLVEPRFRWAALGSVFGSIGFRVEPSLGRAPMVPGSARDVPPWLLAGPVIERIAGLLRHQPRQFQETKENRASPRGHVAWGQWASRHVAHGNWAEFPCSFPDPASDPELMAAIRWTLNRLRDDLGRVAGSPLGRKLIHRIGDLQGYVGSGPSRRPSGEFKRLQSADWLAEAQEAMGWVAEERGLGGARILDGLSWDLPIDAVWEAWVASFTEELGHHTGLTASPFGSPRRNLYWSGPITSMGSLAPDVELRSENHLVWVDAKYKAHLAQLNRHGWQGVSESLQEAHRADLHQALAYAALEDADRVDTILAYPHLGTESPLPTSVATLTRGKRQVRLILAALPFGFQSHEDRRKAWSTWRDLLVA